MRGFMVFGHRGAGVYEPENALKGIRRALMEGADGVEVDVRLTRDRVYWAETVWAPPRRMAVIGFVRDLREVQGRKEDTDEVHRRGHSFAAVTHPTLEEDPKKRERLIAMGIDGVVTDTPDVYVKLIRAQAGTSEGRS